MPHKGPLSGEIILLALCHPQPMVHEKQVATLKHIALMGGVHDYIAISSRELGNVLEISQQSASKKILELLGEALIERDLGARRQRIKLTDKGFDLLRKEYSDYQRIFEMEGIKLEFTDEALQAVAKHAIERNTGARGLRAVLETAMLDVMYELPSRLDVIGCTITEEVISQGAEPLLTFRGERKKKEA